MTKIQRTAVALCFIRIIYIIATKRTAYRTRVKSETFCEFVGFYIFLLRSFCKALYQKKNVALKEMFKWQMFWEIYTKKIIIIILYEAHFSEPHKL